MSSLVKASTFFKDVDILYVNNGPIGAGEKTPLDLTENNVPFFFFQAKRIYVGYVATVLTDTLSALLDWELSLVLAKHFIVVAD